MKSIQHKILLASKSPRRKQLLREAGFQFEVLTLDVDESYPSDLVVGEVAEYIANKKADGAKEYLKEGHILLTSDTIVILDNVIYEKPKDAADAKRMLRKLSGNVHAVITGVCLMDSQQRKSFSVTSLVHFKTLTEEEIEFYIEKYQPYDKAGSYAIQEWIGHCKIHKIEGTYSNIMGLPVDRIYDELQSFE